MIRCIRLLSSHALVWVFTFSKLQGAETHWSLVPLTPPELPGSIEAGWVVTPIDRFVLSKRTEIGIPPTPQADRQTLIRRVYFDLIGLPPSPEEVDAFVSANNPDDYGKLLDRLLGSPRYGERWAQHWMDLVHYAETHGHDEDAVREHAWPYRDYLIQAFNQDKPYARFVEEQVAGDVLFPSDPQATVATAFLATGPWDSSSQMGIQDGTIDKKIAQYLDRDDMVTTTMLTFNSLTVHCARCHDHKFDPVSQEDYYALQAVFAGVDRVDRDFHPDPETHLKRNGLTQAIRNLEKGVWPSELASLSDWQDEAANWAPRFPLDQEVSEAVLKAAQTPVGERSPPMIESLAFYLLGKRFQEALKALPEPMRVYSVAGNFEPIGNFKPARSVRDVRVLKRGDISRPGNPAQPGALSCLAELTSRFELDNPDSEGERRARLARWLSSTKNPLTWRSIVNRVWLHHFGRGLVATPNDFGKQGALPSHPQLLDWLACWFRDSGGSFKSLHKLIMMSAVYRQSSIQESQWVQADPDNLFLGRMPLRRLQAEPYRDAIACISGDLDLEMGGPSARHFSMSKGVHVTPNLDYLNFDPKSVSLRRRSVYRFVFRTVPDPWMQVMDCPDASQLTPQRLESATPQQALALMNRDWMIHQSRLLAARLQHDQTDLEGQIERLFQLAFSRPVTIRELGIVRSYALKNGLANACRMVFNSNEFLYVP